ncbi:MAG: hypothetical protein KDD10_22530, partial [Phaeodactylibacter sp.]|nr:hypothetical protein [Phaeodactylibacter sp.]
ITIAQGIDLPSHAFEAPLVTINVSNYLVIDRMCYTASAARNHFREKKIPPDPDPAANINI